MTLPPDADQPLPPDTGGKRGRKPAPIAESAGVSHRAWLEPVRSFLFASGLTLNDLVDRSGYSKTRISELLRGNGYYPAWEITFSVIRALGLPVPPMRRLWTAAAREAHKEPDWIKDCIQQVALHPEPPPLAHQAFTETMTRAYTAYARAFLLTDHRARWVVTETFDILWLCWSQAATSANIHRYAWQLLRTRVMARAHRDAGGHPDLRAAVFSATEARDAAPGQFAALSELVDLFTAIGRLPHDLMDVTVLRHLCGLTLDDTADVLGVSTAMAHAVDHHARATLNTLLTAHRSRE
ncbi:XRE family transcriptional regulator [Streptomyces sp. NPDC085900]|uniref:XRE family transcriptional regulator n=1 Tax=Streptomyces sp. NPDC085900 TaxID=3365737 RepID=UPI0037D4EA56